MTALRRRAGNCALCAGQSFQGQLSWPAKLQIAGEAGGHLVGDQDLATLRLRCDPGGGGDVDTEQVAAACDGRPGVEADTDSKGGMAGNIEGDQASHVFDVVWPYQSGALSRGGPTFQSGYYGQFISPSNVKYDKFGYMPNSCSKCHANARTASMVCPDTPTVWPTFWPLSEHSTDGFWSACFTSSTAP